jgi:hypothetical protein
LVPPLSGGADAPTPVELDWSGVSEALVRRCNLTAFESHLMQPLLAAGYALVQRAGADGIRARVQSEPGAIRVDVERQSVHREARVQVPAACDSGLGLEVAHALLAALSALPPPAPAPSVPEPPPPPSPPESAPRQPATPAPTKAELETSQPRSAPAPGLWGEAGLNVALPGSEDALGSASLVLLWPVWVLRLGPAATVGLGGKDGLVVAEVTLGGRAVWPLPLGDAPVAVSLVAAADLLLHCFVVREEPGAHVDGRFGAGLRLGPSAWPLFLTAILDTRLQPVSHRLSNATEWRADRFGVQLGLGGALTFWESDAQNPEGSSRATR